MSDHFVRSKEEPCASLVTTSQPRTIRLVGLTFLLALAASVTSAAQGPTPTPGTIIFGPPAITLDNPTDGRKSGDPAQVTLAVHVINSQGKIVTPTQSDPLNLQVYGAPAGVITPTTLVLTSGNSATFTYNGGTFPNSMELVAWMDDPLSGGASLGTTLFVQGNRPSCNYGSGMSFPLKVTSNVPSEIQVRAVVGPANPQTSEFTTFTIDTGSLGTIVTKGPDLHGANVHGPGAAGLVFYDSSGYVFTGNYYLAPVSVLLSDGTSFVQTNPIMVLAIDGVHCHSGYPKCHAPSRPELHYLGVGFDRKSSTGGDLFGSPSNNAFLELTDAQNGTDINAGWLLSATNGVTLGITSTNSSGYNTVTLDPNSQVPGDWAAVPGCYSFPDLPGAPQFCGGFLLDVGIPQMFMDLQFDQRPMGTYTPDGGNNYVPDGVEMMVQAGSTSQPAMSYCFSAVQPPDKPLTGSPAPTFAQWVDIKNIFVNTGRRPLFDFDYFFSGQCGVVGFKQKNPNGC